MKCFDIYSAVYCVIHNMLHLSFEKRTDEKFENPLCLLLLEGRLCKKFSKSARELKSRWQLATKNHSRKNEQMGFCRKSLSRHFPSLVQSDKAFLKEDLGVMFFIQLFFLQIKSKHGNIQSFWCRQPVCYHNNFHPKSAGKMSFISGKVSQHRHNTKKHFPHTDQIQKYCHT